MELNGQIAAVLRNFAAIQTSRQKAWGYRRAAASVAALTIPIDSLLQRDGTLRRIANVGPSSARIIVEILQTGSSPTIEAAISGASEHFLSSEQVEAALRDATLKGPRLEDYHGDLQMHSTYSDGTQTLEEIAAAGISRGYRFCAVTDHSYGLKIAGGMSMTEMTAQHREIDRLNKACRGRFRLLKGIEANIRADGSIDMEPLELARVEIVVAAPHSALRSGDDQTARMVKAVQAPGVHILGHPRGRKRGVRPGVSADWDRVFNAAAKSGVAIEIDGDPRRQDLDYDIARRALDAGCLFALDSDAHATAELSFAECAIAHARLAGIPTGRIVNCWTLQRLLKWAGSRSG